MDISFINGSFQNETQLNISQTFNTSQYIFQNQPPQELKTILQFLSQQLNQSLDISMSQMDISFNKKPVKIVIKPQVLGQMGYMFTFILQKQYQMILEEGKEILFKFKLQDQIKRQKLQQNTKTKKKGTKTNNKNENFQNENDELFRLQNMQTKKKTLLEEKQEIMKRTKQLQEIENIKHQNIIEQKLEFSLINQPPDFSEKILNYDRNIELIDNFQNNDDFHSFKTDDKLSYKDFLEMASKNDTKSLINYNNENDINYDFLNNENFDNCFKDFGLKENKNINEIMKEYQNLDLDKFQWESYHKNLEENKKKTKKKNHNINNDQQSDSEIDSLFGGFDQDQQIQRKKIRIKNLKNNNQILKNFIKNKQKIDQVINEQIDLPEQQFQQQQFQQNQEQNQDQKLSDFYLKKLQELQTEKNPQNQIQIYEILVQTLIKQQEDIIFQQNFQNKYLDLADINQQQIFSLLETFGKLNQDQIQLLQKFSKYLNSDTNLLEIENLRAPQNQNDFDKDFLDNNYFQNNNEDLADNYKSQEENSQIQNSKSFLKSSSKKSNNTSFLNNDSTNLQTSNNTFQNFYNNRGGELISEHITTENMTSNLMQQQQQQQIKKNFKKIKIKIELPSQTQQFYENFVKNCRSQVIKSNREGLIKFENLNQMEESKQNKTSLGDKFYNLMMLQASQKINLIDKKQPQVEHLYQNGTQDIFILQYVNNSLWSNIYIETQEKVLA